MRRGGLLKRGRKARSGLERAAHARFKAEVAGSCLWSVTRPGHRCSGPMDQHHVLKQRFLKQHFLHLKRFEEERFWSIVHDPRLGVSLCRGAHDPVTNPQKSEDYIYFSELPAGLFEAVEEYGLGWRLELECRPGSFCGQGVGCLPNRERKEDE